MLPTKARGALEYVPAKDIPSTGPIHIDEIVKVLDQVLNKKNETTSPTLNTTTLFNIFKIGTSAGGAELKS